MKTKQAWHFSFHFHWLLFFVCLFSFALFTPNQTKANLFVLSSLSNCHETPSSRLNFVSVSVLHRGGCFFRLTVGKRLVRCACASAYVMQSCFAPFMFLVHIILWFYFIFFFLILKERPCSDWSCDVVMCCYLHCLCAVLFCFMLIYKGSC